MCHVIKVSNAVTVYEVDGTERNDVPPPTITVESHWNRNTLVVLQANGKRLTVSADDIMAAIRNATNTAR